MMTNKSVRKKNNHLIETPTYETSSLFLIIDNLGRLRYNKGRLNFTEINSSSFEQMMY